MWGMMKGERDTSCRCVNDMMEILQFILGKNNHLQEAVFAALSCEVEHCGSEIISIMSKFSNTNNR